MGSTRRAIPSRKINFPKPGEIAAKKVNDWLRTKMLGQHLSNNAQPNKWNQENQHFREGAEHEEMKENAEFNAED